MRSRFLKITILVAAFSFSWGAWWGLYHYEQFHRKQHNGPLLRVLVQKNFLPQSIIQMVQSRMHTTLQVTEEPTEIDLVRELLSNENKYDIVELPSFAMRSFAIGRYLAPLKKSDIPALRKVSLDFQHLEFDPDGKYLVPVTWGVSGFVYNPKQTNWDHRITSLFNLSSKPNSGNFISAKISLLDSPVEFLNLLEKIQPKAKAWVEKDQAAKLTKSIQELKNQSVSFTADPEPQLESGALQIAQVSNGQAANFLNKNKNYQYILPKEKGVLWIDFLAVSNGSKDAELANESLNVFLQPDINQKLVEVSHSASVLSSLDNSSLPEMQKAKFIRTLPMFRYQLYMDNDAISPSWLSIFQHAISPTSSPQP